MIAAILSFLGVYRWLALLAVIAGLVAGYFGWEHHQRAIGEARGREAIQALWDADRVQWQSALAKQKLEATQTLAAETAKTAAAEQRLGAFLITQEQTDAKHEAIVSGLQRRLADVAAANGGRLRDPNATAARCGPSGGGSQGAAGTVAANSSGNAPGTDGLLSVQLSDLLRSKLPRADAINDAYASCRATAINDRSQK
jgi:hypothetical protein